MNCIWKAFKFTFHLPECALHKGYITQLWKQPLLFQLHVLLLPYVFVGAELEHFCPISLIVWPKIMANTSFFPKFDLTIKSFLTKKFILSFLSLYNVFTLINDPLFPSACTGQTIASYAQVNPRRANKSIHKVSVNKPRGMFSIIMMPARRIFYTGFLQLFHELHSNHQHARHYWIH